MTSGATFSSSVDLHHAWDNLHVGVPTMASGSLNILGSMDNTNFLRTVDTKTAGNGSTSMAVITDKDTFMIDSSCTQRCVTIPHPNARYLKIESTSGATDVVTVFNVICS